MPSHLAPRFGVLGTAASIFFGASGVRRRTLANRKRNRPSTGRHDLYPRYSRGHTVHPGWHSYGRASTRTVSRNYRGLAGFVLKGEGGICPQPQAFEVIRGKVCRMVVTVNIPDELAAAAKARGLSLEAYVQEILAQQLGRLPERRQPRTPEEIRAWLDSLAQFSDKIPPLPETISREWLYQDHD